MTYHVVVTPRARIEFYNDAIWWAEHRDVDQAKLWLAGFEQAINSLANRPGRCPAARENEELPFDLRQLTYGIGSKPTHRAVFEIRGEEVIIHGIRHLARRDLTPDDLAPG